MNRIHQKLDLLGTIAGIVGSVLCVLAVGLRVTFGPGNPSQVAVSPRSLLWLGIAGLAFACFLKLSVRER